jgi:hypothetical protein
MAQIFSPAFLNSTLENIAEIVEVRSCRLRLWWNWQTRYFEVVVGQPVQVQVLLSAPFLLRNYDRSAAMTAARAYPFPVEFKNKIGVFRVTIYDTPIRRRRRPPLAIRPTGWLDSDPFPELLSIS